MENKKDNKKINPNTNNVPFIFKQKKILTKEEEEDLLYKSLLESYKKHQYKKVYKSIKIKGEKATYFNKQDWKFLQLKTMALQKVILTKFIRYHFSNRQKYQGIKKYFYEENKITEKWISLILELNKDDSFKNTFIELLISFLLKKIITFSKICIKENRIEDTIGFLSLGEKLIKKSISFFTSPESFTLSSIIYLYLSSILISNENYESAIYYICDLIKFCFINLELRINSKNGIKSIFDLSKFEKEVLNGITEIFNIISFGFYHLGVCYEHQGEDYIALQAYKQSKWFGNAMEDEKMKFFQEMIKNLEERELTRNRLIFFFENYKQQKEEKQSNKNNDNNNFNKKKKFFISEKMKEIRFVKIRKFLEKLNLKEIDDEDPGLLNDDSKKKLSEAVNSSTRQINLLNYLLSENFNDVIDSMKKIEINKLNKETANKIQKKIISLKNDKKIKLNKIIKTEENKILSKAPLINKYKLSLNKMDYNNNRCINNCDRINKIYLTERTKVIPNIQKINKLFEESNDNINNKNNSERKYSNKLKLKNLISKSRNRNRNKNNNCYRTLNALNTNKDFSKTINNLTLNIDTTLLTKNSHLTQRNNDDEIQNNLKSYFNKNNKNKKSHSNFERYSNNINKINNINRSKNQSNKYIIPKYSFNKFYSSHKFLKKKNYLENQYERELRFQRLLLKSKNNVEKEEVPSQFNIIRTYRMTENFFKDTLENELNNKKIFSNINNQILNKEKEEVAKKSKSDNIKKIVIYKDNLEIFNINQRSIDEITNSIAELTFKKNSLKKHVINELI